MHSKARQPLTTNDVTYGHWVSSLTSCFVDTLHSMDAVVRTVVGNEANSAKHAKINCLSVFKMVLTIFPKGNGVVFLRMPKVFI